MDTKPYLRQEILNLSEGSAPWAALSTEKATSIGMGKCRRVLFVCNPFWIGGPISWLRRACQYLPEHGWECKLVLPGTTRTYHADWNDWPCPLELLKPVYSGPRLVRSLANAIRSFDPNVVVGVALDVIPNAIRLLRRSNQLSFHYIDTLHNDNAVECERLRPHADVIDAVAVCSEGCGRRVRTQIPELASRVVRFWYPTPCDEQIKRERYASGPLRLVFLARLYQYPKRVLDLIPLCHGLVNADVDFRLTVVGDGPDRAAVEAGIRSIPGIGDRVQFLGWLSNSRALEVLRGQHILLQLSEFEGQPIAMLEGMGCGVVPVVSDITAHREIILPEQDGFLVPVGDISRFVETLLFLASDRGQLAVSAEAAWRKTLVTWHPSVAIAHLANLLCEVSHRPLPPQDGIASISYPATRMSQLGIPHALQGVKRWLLGQPVIW